MVTESRVKNHEGIVAAVVYSKRVDGRIYNTCREAREDLIGGVHAGEVINRTMTDANGDIWECCPVTGMTLEIIGNDGRNDY